MVAQTALEQSPHETETIHHESEVVLKDAAALKARVASLVTINLNLAGSSIAKVRRQNLSPQPADTFRCVFVIAQ